MKGKAGLRSNPRIPAKRVVFGTFALLAVHVGRAFAWSGANYSRLQRLHLAIVLENWHTRGTCQSHRAYGYPQTLTTLHLSPAGQGLEPGFPWQIVRPRKDSRFGVDRAALLQKVCKDVNCPPKFQTFFDSVCVLIRIELGRILARRMPFDSQPMVRWA